MPRYLPPILLLYLLAVAPCQAQQPRHWTPIREALGRQGEVEDGVLRINFPRTDLQDVTVMGTAIDPGLIFNSWFGFMRIPGTALKGEPNGTMLMMGDLSLRQEEIPAVQQAVAAAGSTSPRCTIIRWARSRA